MKHNIWLVNHYATNMFFNQSGRHHWFAENLRKKGYNPTIFCANTMHNVHSQSTVKIPSGKYAVKYANDIPYVFVKTVNYSGNSIQRVKNMLFFYKNLFPAARGCAKDHGKPDVILASSVHPLTWLAGYKLAKRYDAKFVAETRDLWPETLVDMNIIKRNSVSAKLLYALEKFIYRKADKLIFTMEGGKEYVKDKGWDKEIALDKIYYINNGVDIEEFNKNKQKYLIKDKNLSDESIFKIIYTGSIGEPNMVITIVEAAEYLKKLGILNIKFLIFGDGIHKEKLLKYSLKNNMDNLIFKGRVDKKYIPFILSKGNLNVIVGKDINLYKYGFSQNKFFDYLASGRPIISNKQNHSILDEKNCGIVVKGNSPKALADGILKFYNMPKEEYSKYCQNALKAAYDFDFQVLTDKLEKVILELI